MPKLAFTFVVVDIMFPSEIRFPIQSPVFFTKNPPFVAATHLSSN